MKNSLMTIVLFLAVFGFASLLVQANIAEHPKTESVWTAIRDDFNAQIAKAWKLYHEGKYGEVIKLCEKLAKLRPEDNRPYAISGVAHMAQWKMEEASALLTLAIKFSPGNPVLHYTKARADRIRNAKDEGLNSVRKAIELKPDYAEAYLLLGDLLGVGGKNYSEQISAFRKAIELKPDLLDAYRALGMALAVSGDEKEAEETYRRRLI
jgi:protein O-GlcNAc transferase